MTIFDERERAFEAIFAHDEEMRFRALARRNKLVGLWAAEQLGLTGDNARIYADELTRNLVVATADERLIERIRTDFEANGVNEAEWRIREKMEESMARAVMQVRSDVWTPA